jgi:hypothetical protein
MPPSLVAQAPYSPSATRVTETSQSNDLGLYGAEMRTSNAGAVDTDLLAVFAVAAVGMTIWVDAG